MLGWKVVSSSGKEGRLSGFTSRGRVGGVRRRRVNHHIFLIHHRAKIEPDLQLTDLILAAKVLDPAVATCTNILVETDASLPFPLCFHVWTTRLEPICVNTKLDFIQASILIHNTYITEVKHVFLQDCWKTDRLCSLMVITIKQIHHCFHGLKTPLTSASFLPPPLNNVSRLISTRCV